jgi:hypothetical protein
MEDKMKKNLVLVMFIMVTFLAGTFMIKGNSEEDYKVIKNAVKASGGEVSWFKITVFDKKANKEKVNIKVPFSLVEMFIGDKKDIPGKEKCDVDFKKVIEILKKNGPTTLVEIDEEDETVKIWLE